MITRLWRGLFFALLEGGVVAVVACARGADVPESTFPDATSEAAPPSSNNDALPPGDDSSPPIQVSDAPHPVPTVDACGADACVDGPAPNCGDGMIQPGEQCDDGNAVSGDGCSDMCQLEVGFACPVTGQLCVRVATCGNGRVDPPLETCDDGNTSSGDGCSSACQIEPGWQCPIANSKCIAARCGDGIIAGHEQCDDGNALANDGCSSTCQVEPGYACAASPTPPPASLCHRTVCGDGIKEGSEQCDDHNLIPYDGCSPTCTIEPRCDGTGGCTGACGDGLVFPGEECDDGNTLAGDGCSATCKIEPGYMCSNFVQPPAPTLVIPILYRDMLYYNTGDPAAAGTSAANFPVPRPVGGGHLDFNRLNPGLVPGLVMPTLGADHEPVWASNGTPPALSSATNFCWWYHETGCGDAGANPYDKLVYLDLMGNPTTLTLTQGASGTYSYTNPLFFPVDGLGWNAGMNPQTDVDCEPNSADGGTFALRHNFSFTSELHYLFTFQASVAASATPPVFSFTGDDSVWAFINGQLIADLGGVHNPTSNNGGAGYPLNTANATALGLVDGGWYSLDVFQAEQHICRSTYALTLSGFVHVVSRCQTSCGDSIVAGAEQCDQGANNVPPATAYGPAVCTTDCTLAPSCGDALVQSAFGEQCDDGTNLATYGGSNSMVCGPGCKWAPYCGDGVVQSPPEQCDNGANNVPAAAAYGPGVCTDACAAAPFCGDGQVQPQFGEECDGTPGCNAMCKNGPAM